MSIYVDNKGHLISSISNDELHKVPFKLGLKSGWFQGNHYDLTTQRMRSKAMNMGAALVSSKDIVRFLRAKSKEIKQ